MSETHNVYLISQCVWYTGNHANVFNDNESQTLNKRLPVYTANINNLAS